MRSRLAVLLFLPFTLAAAPPEEKKTEVLKEPPSFLMLGSEDGTGVTSMECEGEAPYREITCHFYQIGIRHESEEAFQKGRTELKAKLDKTSEADLLAQYSKVRENLPQMEAQLQSDYSRLAPERAAWRRRSFRQIKSIVACKTKPCAVTAALAQYDADRQSCTISSNRFTSVFKRVGPNKWVSNEGPQGLCNYVIVQVLENEPDAAILWTFTQTTVTGDSNKVCSGVELNKPMSYTWKVSGDLLMNCQVITFGLY